MDIVPRHVSDPIVIALLEMIHRDIDGWLPEDEFAKRLGYSLVHIRRVFQAAMGEPLTTFIRRLRLERAAGRLSLGERRIGWVASEAQYSTVEAFSKAFHAHFECAPRVFRELNAGEHRLMPGFYFASDRPSNKLPTEVGIVTGPDGIVTFQFDAVSVEARFCPDGRVDRRR